MLLMISILEKCQGKDVIYIEQRPNILSVWKDVKRTLMTLIFESTTTEK